MANTLFSIFRDERFMDLTLYQYGYEKCDPLHSSVHLSAITICSTTLYPEKEHFTPMMPNITQIFFT